MSKGRLDAFSDGVIAILITIMVLELKPPAWDDVKHQFDFGTLRHALPAYVLSFVLLAIYWNNHHHMMHTATRVTGRLLWTNMHLLFWLSLVPFVTAWISTPGEFTSWSAAAYGVVTFMAGIAWLFLKQAIIASQGPNSALKAAFGRDWKGTSSGILHAMGIALAFVHPSITIAIQVGVTLMWIIPDPRIESRFGSRTT